MLAKMVIKNNKKPKNEKKLLARYARQTGWQKLTQKNLKMRKKYCWLAKLAIPGRIAWFGIQFFEFSATPSHFLPFWKVIKKRLIVLNFQNQKIGFLKSPRSSSRPFNPVTFCPFNHGTLAWASVYLMGARVSFFLNMRIAEGDQKHIRNMRVKRKALISEWKPPHLF